MTTRHLFNDPQAVLHQSLLSCTILNPSLGYHEASKSIYRKPGSSTRPNRKVNLIAGGGAGHEPAHGGYVGAGMLDGAVSGNIFASPSARQIEECARLALTSSPEADSAEGVAQELLVIINNYTGDVLNFGLAIERIRGLKDKKVNVESVVVADDVSIGRAQGGKVGRRGLAGNILVCKILGAAAEMGMNLSNLKSLGDAVVANLASIGLSLNHCHVPGRAVNESDSLPPDASSLGMGLHNEPGARILQPTPSPDKTITEMIDLIFDTDPDRNFVNFKEGDRVLLYINNLGGMSILEMGGIVSEATRQLEKERRVKIERVLSSSFMTSLNGPGFSISLLNLDGIEKRCRGSDLGSVTALLNYVDLPTEAMAWKSGTGGWGQRREVLSEHGTSIPHEKPSVTGGKPGQESVKESDIEAVSRACKSVLMAEESLTRYDTIVGDGDCGETWAKGAKAILGAIEAKNLDLTSNSALISSLSLIVEDQMGGTSGGLFALYLTGLSRALSSSEAISSTNPWPKTAQAALDTLSRYTPAKPGDRTLMDALVPFIGALPNGLREAVKACRDGAESTKGMKAKLGRSVYVGDDDAEGKERRNTPDTGAWGVLAIACGLANVNFPLG